MQLVVQFGASRDRSVLLFLSNSPQLMQWLKRAMQSEKQSTDGIRVYGAGRGGAKLRVSFAYRLWEVHRVR